MSDIEPVIKPHVEQIRWTEKVVLVVWHLSSTKGWGGGVPGIMQNRARKPEPALQRVMKQKRAGRRRGGCRLLRSCRYVTVQTKLNGSECESAVCAYRAGGQGACVCLCPPPPQLPGLSFRSHVCHHINICTYKE